MVQSTNRHLVMPPLSIDYLSVPLPAPENLGNLKGRKVDKIVAIVDGMVKDMGCSYSVDSDRKVKL